MNETLLIALLSALTSSGFTTLIIFLIQRKDAKNETLNQVLNRLDNIEKIQHEQQLSEIRTELSIHLLHHKRDKITIMRIAEKYFKELQGNFYMTSKFNDWLRKMHMPKPDWFNPNK